MKLVINETSLSPAFYAVKYNYIFQTICVGWSWWTGKALMNWWICWD